MTMKPLLGRKIIITRAAGQARDFARLLEADGAEVHSFPTIQIVPPKSWKPVDQAIRMIRRYDWVLFTSTNGVKMFFNRCRRLEVPARDLKSARLGAIGPKTSAELTALGLKVEALPEEYRAEALADALGRVRGARVLLARAEKARDVLPKTLASRGAKVTIVSLYRTVKSRPPSGKLKKQLLAGHVDAVTFTSSSTVEGFMRHFTARERRRIFDHTQAAVIGPITAATLCRYGIRPAIQARRYTIESLVEALGTYFRGT